MRYLSPDSGESGQWNSTDCLPGSVGWLVPRFDLFERFTRIFHPVVDLQGERTRWASLTQRAHTPWRSDIQLSELSLVEGNASPLPNGMGSTCLQELVALTGLLGAECSYGLWDGASWVSHDNIDDSNAVGINEQSWLTAPMISGRLDRQYRFFSGRINDLPNFGTYGRFFIERQPTVMWCQTGPICLMSDPDYDSSILASSDHIHKTLIRKAAELEVTEVFPWTSLLDRHPEGSATN